MLLLMKGLAFFVNSLVLLLRTGVAHKGINPLADAQELRLLKEGAAEVNCFLPDHIVVLDKNLHTVIYVSATRRQRRRRKSASIQGSAPVNLLNGGADKD